MSWHGAVASGDQLHELLVESRSVIDSAAFRLTVADLLATSFETLDDELRMHMEAEGAGAHEAAKRALPFAKLLAQFHKLSNATLAPTEPFAAAVLATPSLDELSWMSYSGE